MSPTPSMKLAFRVKEAVEASGLSRTTLYELIRTKELPAAKIQGRRLILREDLEQLLRSRRE
jgi:excisionase family DNA binding protein